MACVVCTIGIWYDVVCGGLKPTWVWFSERGSAGPTTGYMCYVPDVFPAAACFDVELDTGCFVLAPTISALQRVCNVATARGPPLTTQRGQSQKSWISEVVLWECPVQQGWLAGRGSIRALDSWCIAMHRAHGAMYRCNYLLFPFRTQMWALECPLISIIFFFASCIYYYNKQNSARP